MSYTATLRGLTTGRDTPYPWRAMPAGHGVTARQSSVPNQAGGAHPNGIDVAEVGRLVFDMHLRGDTEVEVQDLRDELVAAWAPYGESDLEELTVELASGVRVFRGRPRGAEVALDGIVRGHIGAARCEFVIYDPLWYDATLKSVTVSAGGSSGGFVSPFVSPFVSTGTGSSGDAAVTNDGTADAPWTAALSGGTSGVAGARLILNGEVMVEIIDTIPAGSVLTLDSRDQSLLLDGQPRPWAAFHSMWTEIPPGQSTFSYRAASGDGTAQLVWQDASH